MSARTGISEEEYLRTAFDDLDREYQDGELIERALPTYSHGSTQAHLVSYFLGLRKQWPVYPTVETRMKLRPGLYLIPDVVVFWPSKPAEVPDTPPLIVIEILSPDDRILRLLEKCEEYRKWGISHIWLVDPASATLQFYDGEFRGTASLPVPELGIKLVPQDIFA